MAKNREQVQSFSPAKDGASSKAAADVRWVLMWGTGRDGKVGSKGLPGPGYGNWAGGNLGLRESSFLPSPVGVNECSAKMEFAELGKSECLIASGQP